MATLSEDSKYCDVVESYLQNRLLQEGLHPSFQHLSKETMPDLSRPSSVRLPTDPNVPSLLLSKDEESESSDENDMNVSMCRPQI